MLKTIDLIVVVLGMFWFGFAAGVVFHAKTNITAENPSIYNDCPINLQGCEIVAITIEQELQDTISYLNKCREEYRKFQYDFDLVMESSLVSLPECSN
jgi:hypothetical protein